MLFTEKCADPDEKSYYALGGNSSRPSLFAKVPLLGETELLWLAVNCKSGRKLHVDHCVRFCLNSLHAE